ncbi:hypothetical protein PAECIP111802_01174 [Paenibacillus allorhizosphaerae]|uniref:Uncharacterized protein n=1 Tax=Paenibacillus allorhizosphaerae TaxID=2849866 RepID=A0ABN7TDL2_9BACL|nr:hypothetical protein PAECIP111802_01174 [Paenibacillus allorhizosphaerae]
MDFTYQTALEIHGVTYSILATIESAFLREDTRKGNCV